MADERRRFFRIDDTVGVSFRLLTEEEANAQSGDKQRDVDAFSLIAGYETQIEHYLGQLRIKEPVVAAVIESMNKKMNCVISQLELESRQLQRLSHKVQDVNLSACGMAFMIDSAIDVGREMGLNLILRPTNLHISTLGRVVACEPSLAGDSYYIRVNFHDMEHADQEVLIQHIVKRQGAMLREAREGESLDSDYI